jgi:uncharacterized protein (DUF1501 family)
MLDPDISTADALRHLQFADVDPGALDRRRFLQLVGLGVGAGALAGPASSLLDLSLPGLDPSVWAAGPAGPNDGVLIVLGMFGGNDGLNTVVPVDDQQYYGQHRNLAIAPQNALPIDAATGLHPELTAFKQLWDAGQLAIVEGIGYPNPDLSHFNSMAYWMAGSPTGIPTSGWLGRWLDGYLGTSKNLYAAANIGQSVPLHLIGRTQRGTAVAAGRPGFGASPKSEDQKIYAALRRLGAGDPATWRGRIGSAQVDQLDLATTLSSLIPPSGQLSDQPLVAELEVMARLVNANLGLRVLATGWGDFDSHAGQPNQHGERMRELNAAITRFFQVLSPAWASRVTIMTFSEFGRTSWSNDGAGTDHGTAAPHFVLGANVRGGRYGQRPSLAGLQRWDRMPFHVDFRDYYGSVIDGWLGGGGSDVLGGRAVQQLALFARGPGVAPPVPIPSLTPAPTPAPVLPSTPSMAAPAIGRPGRFVALAPQRICDTRHGLGSERRPLGPGETLAVQVAGQAGVPASGVLAVAVNVTSVNPTEPGFFSVFPSDAAATGSSSLNPWPGRAVPNMAIVGVGPDGRIGVFNATGSTDCIVDVMGYVQADSGSGFLPLVPSRLLDTRTGRGAPPARRRGGERIDLVVVGQGGVPTSGVDAVVVNVAALRPSVPGYLSVWPAGTPLPDISNLNYDPGRNVPNLVVCKVGAGGAISVIANAGELDVIADVVGCFTSGGASIVPVAPSRLLDTRHGLGARAGRVGAGDEIDLAVVGVGGVDPAASAVVLNVTATGATHETFVTVYPDGVGRPDASSLNVASGGTIANLVVAKVGANGKVRLFNDAGGVDLIADVTGYFI